MGFSGFSMEDSRIFDALSIFNVSPMDFYLDSRLIFFGFLIFGGFQWIFDGNFRDVQCISMFNVSPMDF